MTNRHGSDSTTGMQLRSPVTDSLVQLIGDQRGYVRVGRKRANPNSWHEKGFSWPHESHALAKYVRNYVNNLDLYFTPCLFDVDTRRREQRRVLPIGLLWADLDGDHDPKALATLQSRGRVIVVRSGRPGHMHVYVPLDSPVDVDTAKDLNLRLKHFLHADPDYTPFPGAMMRLPGSIHQSTKNEVKVATYGQGEKFTVGQLGELLPNVVDESRSLPQVGEPLTPEPIDISSLPSDLQCLVLEEPWESGRFKQAYRLATHALELGLSQEQVHYLLTQHPPTIAKKVDEGGGLATFIGRTVERAHGAIVASVVASSPLNTLGTDATNPRSGDPPKCDNECDNPDLGCDKPKVPDRCERMQGRLGVKVSGKHARFFLPCDKYECPYCGYQKRKRVTTIMNMATLDQDTVWITYAKTNPEKRTLARARQRHPEIEWSNIIRTDGAQLIVSTLPIPGRPSLSKPLPKEQLEELVLSQPVAKVVYSAGLKAISDEEAKKDKEKVKSRERYMLVRAVPPKDMDDILREAGFDPDDPMSTVDIPLVELEERIDEALAVQRVRAQWN